MRTYREIVEDANRHWLTGRFFDAGRQYWLAACVAPTTTDETRMLFCAWICTERSLGRRSEMEQAS